MPGPSRSDAPLRDPQYPQGVGSQGYSGEPTTFQHAPGRGNPLPPDKIYGRLPPTRAESFGRTVGSAVGGVLRFPQRVGQATSRLRKAGNDTRAEASAAVLVMMDNAATRAEYIGHATSATLSDWVHAARRRSALVEDRAVEQWLELRSLAKQRLAFAGRRASAGWNETQRSVARLQREDPVRFLMIVAGSAFVIGAGLRIWRSNSNG